MIQEILPKKFHPEYINKRPLPDSYLLHYDLNKILLGKNDAMDVQVLPKFQDLETEDPSIYDKAEYLFSIDDEEFFLVYELSVPEFGGYVMEGLQIARGFTPNYIGLAIITGSQVYRWTKSRKYCGYCGTITEKSKTERALVCPKCGHIEYPKISPAIIVAIIDGDRILLTKNTRGIYKTYALVAGFMEIGETPEDTVQREVMEEVGLNIKNIKPYKSQPWAFSDTLMIGFTAELDGDDTITIQESELTEAKWFNRIDVPTLPYTISVGQEMISLFKGGKL